VPEAMRKIDKKDMRRDGILPQVTGVGGETLLDIRNITR